MANTNAVLNKAGVNKKDEFYTMLDDIAKELKYYKPYYCCINCSYSCFMPTVAFSVM